MRIPVLVAVLGLGVLTPSFTAAQTTAAPSAASAAPPTASAFAAVAADRDQPGSASSLASSRSNRLQIRAVGSAGLTWFAAGSTFKAVLGSSHGPDVGGGLNLTKGPLYLEIGARRFSKSGERVFVTSGGQVFPLGIPVEVSMTPLDVTAGWRFAPRFGRVIPHAGVGYTRLKYEETSDFAAAAENVAESFSGFHVVGGAEVRVTRWIGLTGALVWTSIADALGDGGAAKAFDETNLGGTSLRISLVIGR